jgi:hypothetical protein
LNVGVAASLAASPRVAWPGVTDVLRTLAVAEPVVAPQAVPLTAWLGVNDSLAVRIPSKGAAWWCSEFSLLRLVAEFKRFDDEEDFTNSPPPGISLYFKVVEVPDGCDTLYVTISAVGDGHQGEGTLLTCKVDGLFCNPGESSETEAPGWITVQRHGLLDDFHDNSIYYTWCTPITPGTHFVEVRLASTADVDGDVFLEAEHFYIDASNTGGGCVEGAAADDPILTLPHQPTLP